MSSVRVFDRKSKEMRFTTNLVTATTTALLLLSVGRLPPATGILEEIATGLEVVIHTIESIQQTWEIVEATDVLKQKDHNANPNIKNMISRKHHELMTRLMEIYRGIQNIEHDVSRPVNCLCFFTL